MAKILLVEDDKSLREIYGVRLMAEGYEIVSAGDGEEALAMAIKERPDLIVSDVMMPKISGFDMLDILRSTTETKNVKVIMMTALSSEDQRARGEALGADRYLVKSQVGIEDVVRTVHDVLGDGAAQPAAPAFTPAPAPAPVTSMPYTTPVASPAPVQPTYSQPEPAPVAQAQPYAAPYQVPQPAAPAPQPYIPPTPAPITEPAQAFAPAPQFSAPAAPFVPPTPAPVFQPAAAPAPQFAAPQPMQQPFQAPAPTSMPQPIAPFSSPAPASLGERVIEPLTMPPNPGENVLDLSSQIEQALNNQSTPPAPTPPTV
jgi:CheY-like chemotaxis protein